MEEGKGHKQRLRYKNDSDRSHLVGVFYRAGYVSRVERRLILDMGEL